MCWLLLSILSIPLIVYRLNKKLAVPLLKAKVNVALVTLLRSIS
jgi:hypothetical protein